MSHNFPEDRNPWDPVKDEAVHLLWDDMRTTYAVLDELEEQLGEAFGELPNVGSYEERKNIRDLLDQFDAVRRVRIMLQEIVDPGDPPPIAGRIGSPEPRALGDWGKKA